MPAWRAWRTPARYCNALKGNYRKGVHKMETLLENPTHAKEFAKNLGGVSVVLGTPVGKEDRNSETLRSMLLASDVANDAVYTWMGQYYEFDSWDELLGDEDRCKVMMANELLWRALSASGVAMGKTVATLAGLSCSAYDDMSAVAASSTAMTAVASSSTAMQALYNAADTTEPILKASSVAIDAFTAKSTTFSRRGTWGTGLNKPAFMLTMKCDYGSISSNRNFAQCGAYKLGTTRRQSDSITQNKEMPMYGWVSLVEAYFVDSNYTTTVRYITW